jgi:hypothetical protein
VGAVAVGGGGIEDSKSGHQGAAAAAAAVSLGKDYYSIQTSTPSVACHKVLSNEHHSRDDESERALTEGNCSYTTRSLGAATGGIVEHEEDDRVDGKPRARLVRNIFQKLHRENSDLWRYTILFL